MLFRKKKEERVVIDERLQHIAFIMDGNGRWAKKEDCRGKSDTATARQLSGRSDGIVKVSD